MKRQALPIYLFFISEHQVKYKVSPANKTQCSALVRHYTSQWRKLEKCEGRG